MVDEWTAFEEKHKEFFTDIAPFQEVVFWPLPTGHAYFIK